MAAIRVRGDWRVEGTGAATRVEIPWRFQAPAALLWSVVMAGWGYGGVTLYALLFIRDEIIFIVLPMLVVWAVVGHVLCSPFFAACGLARETVWREGEDLVVRHSMVGLPWWTWRFPIAEIGPLSAPPRRPRPLPEPEGGGLVVSDDDGPLRPAEVKTDSGDVFRGGGSSPGVGFRCGGKASFIGAGLDEGQAARLAEVLTLRFGLRLGTGPSGV